MTSGDVLITIHATCLGKVPASRPTRLRDQIRVIRENPASRGTEASAEVLVGPP